jgi:putative redox protein
MVQAKVRMVDGLQLVGLGPSGHAVVLDAKKETGGNDSGTRPGELVLLAHAGCTAMDVLSILKKMRIDIEEFEVRVSAEAAEDHPKVWKKVHLEFFVRSDSVTADKLERAITLSHEKYCSVGAMVGKTADVTHSHIIESSKQRAVE